MPPHLHPRSRLTTSLFSTTLLVSFLVVGMPHILPCPAPRTDFADSDPAKNGRRRRVRRRVEAPDSTEEELNESEMMLKKAHECPCQSRRESLGVCWVSRIRTRRIEEPCKLSPTLPSHHFCVGRRTERSSFYITALWQQRFSTAA